MLSGEIQISTDAKLSWISFISVVTVSESIGEEPVVTRLAANRTEDEGD